MGLVVLVKKCQSSLIFYCKIPILCQAKSAQILLVKSDRTDKFLELGLIQIFYFSVVHPRNMCNTRNRSIWRIRLVVKWTIKTMNTIELHYICICWIFMELLKWRKLGIYWTIRFMSGTFFYYYYKYIWDKIL